MRPKYVLWFTETGELCSGPIAELIPCGTVRDGLGDGGGCSRYWPVFPLVGSFLPASVDVGGGVRGGLCCRRTSAMGMDFRW